MMSRIHLYVSGRVQGVAFRGYTRKWAHDLGLTGWVRNLYDGRVEAVVEGERAQIETLVSRIKTGPPLSRVEDIDLAWEAFQGEFADFRIAWLDF